MIFDSNANKNGPFFDILHMLVLMITELQAATVKLRDVIGIIAKPDFKEFQIFLKLGEIYGSGYIDDVDYHKFNLRVS